MTAREKCILAFLLLFGVLSIVTTYTRLSPTADEHFHLRCGMEWWQKGTYTIEPLHPPLARLMVAALPFWMDVRQAAAQMVPEDAYQYKTTLARLGILPFYIFSCLLVFIWSKRLFGASAAVWSLALYITLPAVTAHAGLATTDMAYTAMFLWATMAAIDWLKQPTSINSLLAGLSLALAIGTKFSILLHWPVVMGVLVIVRCIDNRRQSLPVFPIQRTHAMSALMIILPAMVLSLGALYHFSFAPLFEGIRQAQQLNQRGFAIWLYGPLHNQAIWYFFPVVFFFKTPMAFHAAYLTGNGRLIRTLRQYDIDRLFPLLAAVAVMVASMFANIDLGVRHILPVYPLLAIPAGYGLDWLWRSSRWKRIAAIVLLCWQMENFITAFPDRIAYYNELAGAHPEHISLDSDFDWGQGVIILSEAVQKHHIDKLFVCLRSLRINTVSAGIILPARNMGCPEQPVSGWIAVSRSLRQNASNEFAWLNHYEAVEQVGKTLDLYYIPAP